MIWRILLLLQLCIAHPFSHQERSTPLTIRQLSQFPNVTWIENMAVRSNGQLLVTLFTLPDLYQIDPSQQNPTPKLVAQFPEALGIMGIAEIEEDVFAITKGNLSSTTLKATPKSFSVSKANFRNQDQDTPAISKIADLPDAVMLNGATAVEKGCDFLLMADSLAGVVWRLNLKTTDYDVVLNNSFVNPARPVADGGFGVNGVHTRNGYLYFTNKDLGFMRVPIHTDGTPAGDVEVLADFQSGDDFSFNEQGDAYIARGGADLITDVTAAGEVTSLDYENADKLILIEGNTATRFGRTERDRGTLYVTTNGGDSGKVNGTAIQGGRVLAIDLGESW